MSVIVKGKVQWLSKTMLFGYALVIGTVAFNLLGFSSEDLLPAVLAVEWENWKMAAVGLITIVLRQITTGPIANNAVQEIIFWLLRKLFGVEMAKPEVESEEQSQLKA